MKKTTKKDKEGKKTTSPLTHGDLKRKAIAILKMRGFSDNEIREEHPILLANKKRYEIDVAAIDSYGNILVAVECGECKAQKMTILREIIPEVIHLPFHQEYIPDFAYIGLLEENQQLKRMLYEKNLSNDTIKGNNIKVEKEENGEETVVELLEHSLTIADRAEKRIDRILSKSPIKEGEGKKYDKKIEKEPEFLSLLKEIRRGLEEKEETKIKEEHMPPWANSFKALLHELVQGSEDIEKKEAKVKDNNTSIDVKSGPCEVLDRLDGIIERLEKSKTT